MLLKVEGRIQSSAFTAVTLFSQRGVKRLFKASNLHLVTLSSSRFFFKKFKEYSFILPLKPSFIISRLDCHFLKIKRSLAKCKKNILFDPLILFLKIIFCSLFMLDKRQHLNNYSMRISKTDNYAIIPTS